MKWYILQINNEVAIRPLPEGSYSIVAGPFRDRYEAAYEANMLKAKIDLAKDMIAAGVIGEVQAMSEIIVSIETLPINRWRLTLREDGAPIESLTIVASAGKWIVFDDDVHELCRHANFATALSHAYNVLVGGQHE